MRVRGEKSLIFLSSSYSKFAIILGKSYTNFKTIIKQAIDLITNVCYHVYIGGRGNMEVIESFKFRMYPTNEQKYKLNSFIGSSRFIYNHYLYENKDNKYFNVFEAKKSLPLLEEEYPWLREVDSTILRTTLDDLDNAYERCNKGLGGIPKFKKKSYKGSYRTTAIRSTYKGRNYCNIEVDLKTRTIKLPKLGKVEIRGYRNMEDFPYKIYNATISKEANKHYVSVCVSTEVSYKEFMVRNAVGIDLGVKNLIVTSDGVKYDNMQNIKTLEKRLKGLQKALARCEKNSNNRRKLIEKIQRLFMKIKNIRKYITHIITSNIVKENDLICVETLKVQNMVKNHKLAKSILHSVPSEIIRQLEYKTKWEGKKVIKVDTFFPSSQMCSHCDYKNTKTKNLNIRKWECPKCGSTNDRDINASINILYEGVMSYYKEQYA